MENPPLPVIAVDEPAIAMIFGEQLAFAGREGKFVTSRQVKNSWTKDSWNVAIRVEGQILGSIQVSGRAVQLAILIEMMRQEGYELQVSKPEAILKVDGELLEPVRPSLWLP